uniref:Uncharacterized protein n=1 Tax=Anguilla anguilla TaxID=7936 RepID=A0A0E9PDV4_ANGAN
MFSVRTNLACSSFTGRLNLFPSILASSWSPNPGLILNPLHPSIRGK